MARRRRFRRRRGRRRRGMKRKRVTLRRTAREVRMLKAAVERKLYITTRTSESAFVTLPSTPTVTNIFNPVQGDGFNEIIGRRCFVKSVVLRLLLKSASSDPGIARVVILRQKWNQEIDPPVADDVYNLGSTAGTAVNWVLASKHPNIGKNYQTLYDEVISIGPFSNTVDQRFGSGETVKNRVIRIRVNKPFSFVPGSTGFQGRLYLLAATFDATGAVSVAWTTNVYYDDA